MGTPVVLTCLSALLNVLAWLLPAPYGGIASGLVAVIAGFSSLVAGKATATTPALLSRVQGLSAVLTPAPKPGQEEQPQVIQGPPEEDQQGRP